MRFNRWFLPSVLLTACVCGRAVAEDGPHWEPNLEVAKRMAAQSNRLVLVHFWAPWCGPCMRLEHSVFTQPGVGAAMEARYVPVKINVQDYPSASKLYGIETIPADVVMTPNGRVLYKLQCPPDPQKYVGQLNKAAAAATASVAGGPGDSQHFASLDAPSVPAVSPSNNVLRPQPSSSAGLTATDDPRAATGAAGSTAMGSSSGAPAPASQSRTASSGDAGGTMTASYRPSISASAAAGAGQTLTPLGLTGSQPHLGLDGFCPVTLIERSLVAPSDAHAWQRGDARWGAVHRGVTYLFVSPAEQKKFLQSPDRYAPALSGNDPVLAFEKGQLREGRREFGALSDGRMYLFVDETDFEIFKRDPRRYEQQVWRAENPLGATLSK